MDRERVAAAARARGGSGDAGYAEKYGEEELWAATGILHDLDYERHPDLETGHPRVALALFEEKGYPQELIGAVAGHAPYLGVPRETRLAKALFAVDELTGFIAAVALVRPTKLEGLTPKSVKEEDEAAELRRGRRSRRTAAGSGGVRRGLRPARRLCPKYEGRQERSGRSVPQLVRLRRQVAHRRLQRRGQP